MPPRVLWLAVAFSAGCSGLQQHDRLPVRPQPRRALLRSAASVALALAARPPVARGADQAALFGMQSLMEDAAKKVPANAGVELLGDWTIESGKDAGGQRSVRAYKNSRSAVVSGADPRGEGELVGWEGVRALHLVLCGPEVGFAAAQGHISEGMIIKHPCGVEEIRKKEEYTNRSNHSANTYARRIVNRASR